MPNRSPGRHGSAGEFIWLDPATGVAVSAAAAKRGRALPNAPGQSPFYFAERRSSVWESILSGSVLPHLVIMDHSFPGLP